MGDLGAEGAIDPGERTLLDQLPDLGNEADNWAQNERVLLNEFSRSSSEYGPVRNATSFDPPDEDEIDEIVKRRFAPILGIFTK